MNHHPLQPHEISLYFHDLSEYQGSDFLALLSSAEIEKANQMRFDYLRERVLISHGLKRLALSQHLNILPQDLSFEIADGGKPLLCAEQSHEIDFNISHAGNQLLVGVGRQVQIGVDIEQQKTTDIMGIAKRFFHPDEIEFLENSPSRDIDFFQIWSQKEAFIKAMGKGLAYGLERFCTLPGQAIVMETDTKTLYHLKAIQAADGFSAAVCSSKEIN